MHLGALYTPSGLALETAQAVLEAENVRAVNVAWGCTNMCKDCFIRYTKPGEIRYPKIEPVDLVKKQIEGGLKTDGVFISFETDPLLSKCNLGNTIKLVCYLVSKDIHVAVLSKLGAVPVVGRQFKNLDGNLYEKVHNIRHGMTIKSADEKFRKHFEPNAMSIEERIKILHCLKKEDEYTWVSDEPHPCPDIYKQDDQKFWESINFVDFIIFGKWNYNSLANTEDARKYYRETVSKFIDFCNDYGIRYHVKNKTLDFIKGKS